MRTVCLIPARYNSTRFKGKALHPINGIPLLKRVYTNAIKSYAFDDVLIVAEGKEIEEFCINNKLKYIMQLTNNCKCGTDAIAEVSNLIKSDYYVNLQGDEPLLMSSTLENFVDKIVESEGIAFNAIKSCYSNEIENKNIPKVVLDYDENILFMSRYPIPYRKTKYKPAYFKELGLHAYTKQGLDFFYKSKQLACEQAEGIEFLRFLEYGKPVKAIELELPFNNHAIDVPEDVKIVEEIMKNEKIK